ncbi:ABC transporter ATP-binding protein [Thermobrachium celere]|uniref:Ferric iron ABC transporter, ATP-binding protein n=1 Tax=Thermobrachium celere DSM 8682 TaxID=941824 RepID=R7RNB8_9CLOT|nr:ABC transporter ATP-binding protein [Thermobrachium celere]CDF57677.1 Ferric iron ABC transporter, ATP-binding protein [Thermobrachium celere DSM 8682]
MSVAIIIENVVKRYEKTTVIPNLSLQIKNGEFFTLLGPSGCGKTTLLRMIAGFNSIDGGCIKFDDKVINEIPAYKRNIGMVFQNYAIFPHLTVKENVEYGLKLRKVPKSESDRRVEEILKTVKMYDYKDRLPDKLSGGQQQRVALARAIVIRPNVLLMDEPLSNLDAKLRIEMRSVIRDIQKQIGITTVYVTHDQEEALAISDRIAVMKDGVVQQVGTPCQIYKRPTNIFVATFIGSSNLIKAKINIENGERYVVFNKDYRIKMNNLSSNVKDGQDVIVSIRPEELKIANKGLKVKILKGTFFGKFINYEFTLIDDNVFGENKVCEFVQDISDTNKFLRENDIIYLEPDLSRINVFNEDGSINLIEDVILYE